MSDRGLGKKRSTSREARRFANAELIPTAGGQIVEVYFGSLPEKS